MKLLLTKFFIIIKNIFALLGFLAFVGIITIIIFLHFFDFPSDYCIEDGDCKEGRKINSEFGKIIINKENCEKHNWAYNEIRKECKIRYK